MRVPLILVALLLSGAVTKVAAEVVVRAFPPLGIPAEAPAFPNNLQPGRGEPERAANSAAYRLTWDKYHSLVVVVASGGSRSQAWVVTYDGDNNLVVAYRGKAFMDKDGILHIDARQSILTGPQKEGWSPDSFALTAAGELYTLDDQNPGNVGTVSEKIDPVRNHDVYERLLILAEAIVDGTI